MSDKPQAMLDNIESEAKYTASMTGRRVFDKRVMDAMAEVARDQFVPSDCKVFSYDNRPLPIGYGQTISQPYIVALMTDLLDLTPDSVVLEIGTGSGYQTAVLSRLVNRVYSIETIPELSRLATERLKKLKYDNIETRCGDGYNGWEQKAPFDAIMVTAAATHIPPALIDQLKPGGRMLVPVGLPHMHQELILLVKELDGSTHTDSMLSVAFVPLVMEKNDL